MASGIVVGQRVILPHGLDAMGFERKVVMRGLTDAARPVRLLAKKMLAKRRVSKAGEVPGRRTGTMWRHVKIHKSKSKDKFWTRVQIDTIKTAKTWYPAPLMYGSPALGILPRRDAVWDAGAQLDSATREIVARSLQRAIKWWR